jgi:hypothetical protein
VPGLEVPGFEEPCSVVMSSSLLYLYSRCIYAVESWIWIWIYRNMFDGVQNCKCRSRKASLLCVPIGPELGYDGLRGKLFPKNQSIPDVVYQSLS